MDVLENLIQLQSFPVRTTLDILLKDKTTKKNIIWATSSYKELGEQYADDRQITVTALTGLNPIMLQPKIMKAMKQTGGTYKKSRRGFHTRMDL